MFFLLRAGLVIGALSYLAISRDMPASAPRPDLAAPAIAAWDALPAGAREQTLRMGAAEIGRRMTGAALASRDTLAETDRQPAWRGVENR